MDEITPKTNTELFGHDEAEALLLRDFAGGTLAHGWLISGPRGIGKATLAYKFARLLLTPNVKGQMANVNESNFDICSLTFDDAVARRIAAGSHADLLVVEQEWDEKKEEYKNEISVEQAREIAKFLSLTPGEGQWRVVIIDSIDALNTNAANAILKILEEPPPQAILLLVSHNPGRLLPTIRSRCRNLRLQPPGRDHFVKIMRHVMPTIDGEEMKALAQLSGGSPGVALELQGQGAVALYGQLLGLLEQAPALDAAAIHAFADQLSGGQVHANWRLFTRLVLALFERVAHFSLSPPPAGGRQGGGLDWESEEDEAPDFTDFHHDSYNAPLLTSPLRGEESTLRRLAALHPAPVWAEKWQAAVDQFSLAQRLHLDYKQVIITFFHSIESKDIMVLSA